MLFVKVDDLKVGMRLGKPIYNRNGVLLYERDSRLTMQAIYGIRNFGLIGLYILEPAEPVPPMSEEDLNFERFQTMSVFSIREDLDLMSSGKKDKGLDWLCSLVIKNYVNLPHKINFIQSLRSSEDFIYKHSLNVAILTAITAGRLKLPNETINMLVKAAILHEIGILELSGNTTGEELDEVTIDAIRHNTLEKLHSLSSVEDDIVATITRYYELTLDDTADLSKVGVGANILFVANAYDQMTAMKSYEEPTSEFKAFQQLMDHSQRYDAKVVQALLSGINILYPGVCVQFTNYDKGLVIVENKDNVFEPWALSFTDNNLYDMSSQKVKERFQIQDIMKTMDNRIKLDPEILKEYQ